MARISNGKKIDTWKISNDGQTIEVDVFIVRGGSNQSAKFVAKCDALKLHIENANIDELERLARAEAKSLMSLEYSEMLYIAFSGGGRRDPHHLSEAATGYGNDEIGSSINVKKFLLSEPDANGKRWAKTSGPGGGANAWNGHVGTGMTYDAGRYYALLPNTPENRAGLRRIFEAYSDLNKNLRAFLDLENIESNLLRAGSGEMNLFLTAGSPAETEQKDHDR